MRTLTILTVLMAALAGCAGPDGAATSSRVGSVTTLTSATTPRTSTTTSPTTTEEQSSTSSTVDETTTTLAGDPVEFGPAAGDTVAVVGVAHDDVLNLREGPGVDYDVVAEIPSLVDDLIASGETRDIGQAFWVALSHDDTDGWVNLRYVAHLGVTEDETSAVVDELGERPTAESMEELGRMVAETFASREPPSDVVQVSDANTTDLGEVRYDVVGLGDDAVVGLRVHVFGEPRDGGFSLRTVEVTTLCGRGVTGEGLCL